MTATVVHLWRLARWGRTLGRNGALRGIERDRNAPASLRRLARLARLGSFAPRAPRYAVALRAIGPAAVKLGQTLATRPDLIGEDAAHDLLALQDRLPPLPPAQIRAAIEATLGRPVETVFASFEEDPVGAASIAQVHRAVTPDGRTVAVKVLRPGVDEDFARAIDTYRWAAAHLERMGSGEALRLRPRLVIETFARWTARELDLRREGASASELAGMMEAEPAYHVPAIDWERTTGRVLTLEWIDGVKLTDAAGLARQGNDPRALAVTLVQAFLRQAISEGFFHADMHQGNLFALPGDRIAAIDFGIMGRIDRRARVWLAEILYGLITGDYARVAEIHFEAGYVPAHHNVAEFATALRAVGEPMRGRPVKDLSVGAMLDGLFAITRDFEMQVQPHLLLLQKTMVMVEGVATTLDPDINMWEVSGPFVREWIRTELGPEAVVADRLIRDLRTLRDLPELVRRIAAHYPPPGGAPPAPPLRTATVVERPGGWRALATALLGAGIAVAGMAWWG